MWGWLDSVVSGLKSLWETITNLPGLIVNGLKSFFDNVVNAIVGLPSAIVNGIKAIFIPDTEYIDTAFGNFTDELNTKFNIDTSAFESLFESEQPLDDVNVDYNIPGVGDFNFKILDTSFLKDSLSTFRPIIRGFLVLLILFYHIKQFIGFFGYDAGVIAGRSDWISYNKQNTGGHKE